MGFTYLLIYVLLAGIQMICNKIYASKTNRTTASYLLYLIIMGATAAFCFYLIGGCDMTGDTISYGLSLVACLCVILNTVISLLCMAYVNLPTVTVTQNAGQLILPAIFGAVFLHEEINMMKLIGMFLIMCAFLITYYGNTRGVKQKKDSKDLLCILFFFTCSFGTIVHKLFTVSNSISSNEAYLSMLNIYMVPMIIIAFLFNMNKQKVSFKEYTKDVQWKNYIYVLIGSVIGCFGLVFSMRAMSMMDMTIYSSLQSSLYMIFLTLASRFILKEKVTKYNYIALVFAIVSVIFTSLA